MLTIQRNRKPEIATDRITIGKIGPGKSVAIMLGWSDDGSTKHPAAAFFARPPGSTRDTREAGPDADATSFSFGGKLAWRRSARAPSAGASAGPANDGTVSHLYFLGGPNNADGPCYDCFGPKQTGTLPIP